MTQPQFKPVRLAAKARSPQLGIAKSPSVRRAMSIETVGRCAGPPLGGPCFHRSLIYPSSPLVIDIYSGHLGSIEPQEVRNGKHILTNLHSNSLCRRREAKSNQAGLQRGASEIHHRHPP